MIIKNPEPLIGRISQQGKIFEQKLKFLWQWFRRDFSYFRKPRILGIETLYKQQVWESAAIVVDLWFVTMQKDVYFKLDYQFIKILFFSTLCRLWVCICVGKNFATILAQLDFLVFVITKLDLVQLRPKWLIGSIF